MTFNKKTVLAFSISLLFTTLSFGQTGHRSVARHSTLRTSIAGGQVVYKNVCLSCHQPDGGGVQNMYPPLINTTYILGNKKKLILIVLNGFKENVEINGDTYSNVMAPHADLTDRQIADVLTFVRKGFGNKASRVYAYEVKRVRAGNKK